MEHIWSSCEVTMAFLLSSIGSTSGHGRETVERRSRDGRKSSFENGGKNVTFWVFKFCSNYLQQKKLSILKLRFFSQTVRLLTEFFFEKKYFTRYMNYFQNYQGILFKLLTIYLSEKSSTH